MVTKTDKVWMVDVVTCESVARVVATDCMRALGMDVNDLRVRNTIIREISDRLNGYLDEVLRQGGSMQINVRDVEIQCNINQCVVWLQLNELGRKIHRDYHQELQSRLPARARFDYMDPEETRCGWSRWQLSEVLEIFGKHIEVGRDLPFDSVIRIGGR